MSHVVSLAGAKLIFPQALQMKSLSGVDDWINDDFVMMPIHIDAERLQQSVQLIQPLISDVANMRHFLAQHIEGVTQSFDFSHSLYQRSYHWGELFLIDWGQLGYAPGGIESFLLPHHYYGVQVGFFQFDWQSFNIRT